MFGTVQFNRVRGVINYTTTLPLLPLRMNFRNTLPSTPPPPLSPLVAVPPSAAVWSMPLCRVLWFLPNHFRKKIKQLPCKISRFVTAMRGTMPADVAAVCREAAKHHRAPPRASAAQPPSRGFRVSADGMGNASACTRLIACTAPPCCKAGKGSLPNPRHEPALGGPPAAGGYIPGFGVVRGRVPGNWQP